MLSGVLCQYCVLFPESPTRGGNTGAKPGVLVLAPHQKPCTKALDKDGVLLGHQQNALHRHAEEKADIFRHSYCSSDARDNSMLAKNRS